MHTWNSGRWRVHPACGFQLHGSRVPGMAGGRTALPSFSPSQTFTQQSCVGLCEVPTCQLEFTVALVSRSWQDFTGGGREETPAGTLWSHGDSVTPALHPRPSGPSSCVTLEQGLCPRPRMSSTSVSSLAPPTRPPLTQAGTSRIFLCVASGREMHLFKANPPPVLLLTFPKASLSAKY